MNIEICVFGELRIPVLKSQFKIYIEYRSSTMTTVGSPDSAGESIPSVKVAFASALSIILSASSLIFLRVILPASGAIKTPRMEPSPNPNKNIKLVFIFSIFVIVE